MCERVSVMYAGTIVEEGTADQLFAHPRHPYTLGLLQSVPRLDTGRRQKLHPIAGAPRDMLSAPASCPFAPRCRFAHGGVQAGAPGPRAAWTRGSVRRACIPVDADEWRTSRLGGAAA